MVYYKCLRCGFNTPKKSNIISHVNAKKKCQAILNDIDISDPKYKDGILSKNSLEFFNLHNKEEQSKMKEKIILLENEKKELREENKGLREENKIIPKLKEENKELKKKLEEKCKQLTISNNSHNYSHNNICANIDTMNITINNYKTPNIEYITKDTIKNLIKKYPRTITTRLITKIYFNSKHPENHSIFVSLTDAKNYTVHVFDGTSWKIESMRNVVNFILDKIEGEIDHYLDPKDDKAEYKQFYRNIRRQESAKSELRDEKINVRLCLINNSLHKSKKKDDVN